MNKIKTAVALLMGAVLMTGFIPFAAGCKDGNTPPENAVRYSDFGAKGDGKTDDFAAIRAAHEHANQNGLPVAADKGAVYYIGGKLDDLKTHTRAAEIKTDTYWMDARFIIDDVGITETSVARTDIFEVVSDYEPENIYVPDNYTLAAGQKKVNMSFEEPKLLYIVNKNKKDFIRSGADQNNGDDRQEIILVNTSGRVDKSTPITWDYDKVTTLKAYSVSDKSITISGGSFTTFANDSKDAFNVGYTYYLRRGISVYRPNVRVKNLTHNIVYSGDSSVARCPYAGFLGVEMTTNVIFENCTVMGHRTNSSYDIRAKLANDVLWYNVKQFNQFEGNGIYGSNYCRNLRLDGCELNRFDAHKGVYNATLRNCTFKGGGICVTGFGKLTIDGVTRISMSEEYLGEADFLGLRTDYGSFWKGDIVIKNCVWNTSAAVNYVVKVVWRYEWDYGYVCSMPTTVTIDNLKINYYGSKLKPYPYYYVFSNIDPTRTLTLETLKQCANPLVLTKKVTVKNCSCNFALTHNQTGLLENTEFVQKTVEVK